jgi:hypothetical protein
VRFQCLVSTGLNISEVESDGDEVCSGQEPGQAVRDLQRGVLNSCMLLRTGTARVFRTMHDSRFLKSMAAPRPETMSSAVEGSHAHPNARSIACVCGNNNVLPTSDQRHQLPITLIPRRTHMQHRNLTYHQRSLPKRYVPTLPAQTPPSHRNNSSYPVQDTFPHRPT